MAWTRHNPNGLVDGMVVRKVSSPSKAFRVRGDPDAGRATFVAVTKGERTVLNGNARNYRPETDDEARDRTDISVDDDALLPPEPEPAPPEPAPRTLRAVETYREPDIAQLCERLRDAVAAVDDDTCSPEDAAAIVRAAAELNWAVASDSSGEDGP